MPEGPEKEIFGKEPYAKIERLRKEIDGLELRKKEILDQRKLDNKAGGYDQKEITNIDDKIQEKKAAIKDIQRGRNYQ